MHTCHDWHLSVLNRKLALTWDVLYKRTRTITPLSTISEVRCESRYLHPAERPVCGLVLYRMVSAKARNRRSESHPVERKFAQVTHRGGSGSAGRQNCHRLRSPSRRLVSAFSRPAYTAGCSGDSAAGCPPGPDGCGLHLLAARLTDAADLHNPHIVSTQLAIRSMDLTFSIYSAIME
jgi:hypothetical protein